MDRAVESFRGAWEFYGTQTDDALSVFRLARLLAAALYNDGRTRESIAFLRSAAAAIAQCDDRRVRARAWLTFAAYLVDSGDIDETRTVLRDIDAALIEHDPGSMIVFWQTTCRVCELQGDVEGVRAAADRLCAMGDVPDAHALIEGLAEAGTSALIIGETALAARCLDRATDIAVALELTASHGGLLVTSALERVLSAQFVAARALVTRGFPLIGEGRLGRQRAVIAALAVGAALDDREMLDYEPDAAFIESAFETDLPSIYGPLAALCAQRLVARGEHLAARDVLRRAVRAATAAVPLSGSFPLVIVAAQQCDRIDAHDVRSLCAATVRCGPAARHAADLGTAILEWRFGDRVAATAAARRAAGGFGAIGWPVYQALALERAGERDAATLIRTRVGYRGSAAPSDQPEIGSVEGLLSPREREVAQLVANGHTNREIAVRLSVSVKLVEKNISSIYAKLGLKSRSGLTARVLAGDRDQRPAN